MSGDRINTKRLNKSEYIEEWDNILRAYWNVTEVIYNSKTKYQKIFIGKNPYLGTFLSLDDRMQSSEFDEYIYHEALVHPAMVTAYPVKNVLIIGNGEGCVTREVLKYKSVESVDWVDLDKDVVEICREKLPYTWKGKDCRVNKIYRDGYSFMENMVESGKKYDTILMDLTEYSKKVPISNKLFSKNSINLVKSLLTKKGSFVTQCVNVLDNGKIVRRNVPPLLDQAFKYNRTLHFFVPSFLTEYRLVLANNNVDPMKVPQNRIHRIITPFVKTLRYYDDIYHYNIIILPRGARLYGEKTF